MPEKSKLSDYTKLVPSSVSYWKFDDSITELDGEFVGWENRTLSDARGEYTVEYAKIKVGDVIYLVSYANIITALKDNNVKEHSFIIAVFNGKKFNENTGRTYFDIDIFVK